MGTPQVTSGQIEAGLRRNMQWMYESPGADNVGGNGNTGPIIQQKNENGGNRNQGPNLWVLPSCFDAGTGKLFRTLNVPANTSLLCIVAESYASDLEVAAQGQPDKDAAARNLDSVIDPSGTGLMFGSNGVQNSYPITSISLSNVPLNIPADNPIISRYHNMGYSAGQRIVSAVIRYGLITGDLIANPGTYMITCSSLSPEINGWKEPRWRNNIDYTITVS